MSNINFFQQPLQQPQYQQVMPKISGRWSMARNYSDVLNTPIPSDGSAMFFFMPEDERMYSAYMDNGQKYVQGFDLKPIAIEGQPEPKKVIDTNEARIQNLENQVCNMSNAVSRMVALFEGSAESESSVRTNDKQSQTKTK